MEPKKSEEPKIVLVGSLNLQEIANSIFADIFDSMNKDPCREPGCKPYHVILPNDLNQIINPAEVGDKPITIDQEKIQKIIYSVALPLIMENKKQGTLISVLTARVQALEMQLSKQDKLNRPQ